MDSWCTTDDVAALIEGVLEVDVLQEFADQATDTLYILSGRKFTGSVDAVVSATATHQGIIKLANWQPVTAVESVTIDDVDVEFTISTAMTFVTVSSRYRHKLASIALTYGQAAPASGRRAAKALAAEMVRGDSRYIATGASDARPSSRLTSITRQNVTYSFADPSTLMKTNQTGVYAVDLFLQAVNPQGARYQPKVVTI